MALICFPLRTNDIGILSCACWPFLYLIWRNVCWNVCLFFNWVAFYCWLKGIPYIFLVQVLYQVYDLQTFSPILWLCFYFLVVFFEAQKEMKSSLFFLLLFMLFVSHLRNRCLIQSRKDLLLFSSKNSIVGAVIFVIAMWFLLS